MRIANHTTPEDGPVRDSPATIRGVAFLVAPLAALLVVLLPPQPEPSQARHDSAP